MGLPPGPWSRTIQTLRFARDADGLFRDCHRRFGDPFTLRSWVGKAVVTGRKEGVEEIVGAPAETFGALGSAPLEPILGRHSLILLEGERHTRMRKLVTPPFHGERMRAYARTIRDATVARTEDLRPGPVTIDDVTQSIALDVILRAVFGFEEAERVERFHELNRAATAAVWPIALFVPALRNRFIPRWRRFQEARDHIDRLLLEQIERRRRETAEREDILGMLLAARDEAGEPLSDEELRDELMTLLAAGHETTALSLAWALLWIHRDPAVLARLVEEVRALGEDPEPERLVKLPWLGAVCDETLRLRPVVSVIPRMVLRPFQLRGWTVEPGTGVIAAISLVHTDPEVFPDPGSFRPERFLDRKYSPSEYIPFGGGVRRCVGAAFAAYEMRIVLGTIVARCRFRTVDDRIPPVARRNITAGPKGGISLLYDGRREP